MGATELTDEQRRAVETFVSAMGRMGEAISELEAAGLDAATALRAIPGETEGTTAYDSLPPILRMMLA